MYELEKEKENQMKAHFKKKEFLKLKIIGQFNKGFIVCTLNKQDLFILDQHACNERYNLEKFTSLLKIDS
jgi:DNA mismatch repair protein PMS2